MPYKFDNKFKLSHNFIITTKSEICIVINKIIYHYIKNYIVNNGELILIFVSIVKIKL